MPQIFWSKRVRTNIPVIWVAAILINVGMWCERFIIIVTSLHRDFLPSSWANYAPTWVDISLFIGTIGLFSTLFLLFLKFVPAVAVTEVKELRHELEHDPTRRAGGGDALMSGGHDREPGSSRAGSCWRSSRRREALLDGHAQDARGRLQGPRHPHAVSRCTGSRRRSGSARPKIPTIVLLRRDRGRVHRLLDDLLLNVIDFPINVGNRPPHSPPANIPITFELAVLLAGGSSFFGFFALAGLPRPTTRCSSPRSSARASIDGFFLSVELPIGTRRRPGARRRARRRRDRRRARRRSRSDDARARLVSASRSSPRWCSRPPATRTSSTRWPTASRRSTRYKESDFFADGLSMRAPPEGTVPRERITLNPRLTTGREPDGRRCSRTASRCPTT